MQLQFGELTVDYLPQPLTNFLPHHFLSAGNTSSVLLTDDQEMVIGMFRFIAIVTGDLMKESYCMTVA